MTAPRIVRQPTRIPVPGDKLIEEFFGRVHTGTREFSVAHMVAPPGWEEPAQTPRFGEITIVLRGRLRVELEGGAEDLGPSEVLWVPADARVRYTNPFEVESEYWAICLPAFSIEAAGRDAGG